MSMYLNSTTENLVVLIMAGGSGERFWPLSTSEKPKQLLRLIDSERSLIKMTVDRILPLTSAERIFIGTNAIQAKAVIEELPELPEKNILIEPAFRDTAAAIGFGAVVIEKMFPGSTMIVLASDHIIKSEEEFRNDVMAAVECAQSENSIVTLGIKPSKPETGYGYLQVEHANKSPLKVLRFCEKPSLDKAVEYVNSGNYLWNSGMFIFKIAVIMEAFKNLLPDHYRLFKEIEQIEDITNEAGIEKLTAIFSQFTKISIDFGIMEKFQNIKVVPSDFGWSDIGSYTALPEFFRLNENSSVIKGVTVNEIDSHGNIIISTTGKKISLLGIEDSIIVDTPDNILICSKKEAQNIKKLLK
ncbi:MAG: sugar phosphate nucleotidyltransferase [Bacteroidales bacterium]|nr:sugar phosphate nucleotidyltransferase [Bacteroidales bacterium]